MNTAEIQQCVLDIKSWFSRSKGGSRIIEEPASAPDIQRLEKAIDTELPRGLKILLQETNGGLYFMERKLLSTADISNAVSELEGHAKWRQGFIPFCAADESSYLVINTNRDDEVREFEKDEGLGDVVGNSFVQYLEEYRNQLLSGNFEFLEDVGVIEKMGRAHK
jgi:hypothetical protein